MKKANAIELVNLLKKAYPHATCSLDFSTQSFVSLESSL